MLPFCVTHQLTLLPSTFELWSVVWKFQVNREQPPSALTTSPRHCIGDYWTFLTFMWSSSQSQFRRTTVNSEFRSCFWFKIWNQNIQDLKIRFVKWSNKLIDIEVVQEWVQETLEDLRAKFENRYHRLHSSCLSLQDIRDPVQWTDRPHVLRHRRVRQDRRPWRGRRSRLRPRENHERLLLLKDHQLLRR